MRILQAISTSDPSGGGPIEFILRSGQVLKDLGHEVEIVCVDPPDSPWLAKFPLKTHAVGGGKTFYRYSSALRPWLERHACEYDAVVVHGIWQYMGVAVQQVMTRLNRPYCVFMHGMLDPWFKTTYPLKHLKKSLYWPWADYKVVRDATAVLFTCEEEKILARQSFKLYRAKEWILKPGTSRPDGEPGDQRELFFNSYPYLKGVPFLLFLSRIHPKKGIDILIKAFAQECAAAADLKLVVAGPNSVDLEQELKQLAETLKIADRIEWLGMLPVELKWAAFHSCDAFVLPSHQENFGMVVAEALACAKPTLISDKVNIWREVVGAGAGLVGPDTVEGTAKMLRQWMTMAPTDRVAMSRKALECFESNFELGVAVDAMVATFQAVKDEAESSK